MTIELNGRPYELADGATVQELITAAAGSARGSAVVVDDEIVPRSTWAERRLAAGQRVELITAVQGG